jgi:NAD(P)H-dependent FMN reductase
VIANFLSWTSRSEEVQRNGGKTTITPISGKRVGVISGGGGYGGAKAQAALRSMEFLKLQFIDLPEGLTTFNVFEPGKVDMVTGDVLDEGMKEKIRKFVENLVNQLEKK